MPGSAPSFLFADEEVHCGSQGIKKDCDIPGVQCELVYLCSETYLSKGRRQNYSSHL